MEQKLAISDLSLNGKKVLMRVDFNVPQDKQGNITDDMRIRAALPSIQYVLDQGGSVILMSHLGRPKGRTSELTLAPCSKRLSELLHKPVKMAPDCVGPEVLKLANDLKSGEVLLLENLRFHDAEEKPEKDPNFAKKLASLGDVYINDAFGTAHRAHSSTATIAQYFPQAAAAGFLLEKEIQFLGDALLHPKRPFYAIIGGAKISSKIGVLKSLIQKVDGLLIGGGMAYTFLKAEGVDIGDSLYEPAALEDAKSILKEVQRTKIRFLLPQDFVIAEKIEQNAPTQVVDSIEGIPDGWQGLDIGPKTVQQFKDVLSHSKTVFWNGPLGVFEVPRFAEGTQAVAKYLSGLPALKIVGGGDSVSAIQEAGLGDSFDHLSTGGGASLEYIEFGTLPGIEALSEKKAVHS